MARRNSHKLSLRNKTTEVLTIVSVDTGCGCVKARASGEPIAPGGVAVLFNDVLPTLQDLQFVQSVRLRFDASSVHDLELRITGEVHGPVSIEPRAINSRKSDGTVDVVVAPVEQAVIIQSCKEVRGVFSILSQNLIDNKMQLNVKPNLDHGQAVALLRVTYKEGDIQSSVDVPLVVQGTSEVRFIPSSLAQLDGEEPVRLIVVFTSNMVPDDGIEASVQLKSDSGEKIAGISAFQVIRMSNRRFDVFLTFGKRPSKNRGFVTVRFVDREYSCPFIIED